MIAFLLALAQAAAGTPSVSATTSKPRITVGETFFVDVRASGPADAIWSFPAQLGTGDVELVLDQQQPLEGEPTLAAGSRRYRGIAFGLDQVTVPPIPVGYRLGDGSEGEATTEAITLRVVSLLPMDSEEQKLTDIRSPGRLDVGTEFWVALGVLLAALAALALHLYRRRRPDAFVPTAPRTPPDREALEALDALDGAGLLATGQLRDYYIRLADIAKRYLERRLGAPVLEMTSSEAVSYLRGHGDGRTVATPMRDLAGAADFVKFAKGVSPTEEAERHLRTARQIVEELEQRLRPADDEADATLGAR